MPDKDASPEAIEVTPAMIEAGASLLRSYDVELADPEDYVVDIFLAMVSARDAVPPGV